jgi:hypothetical protein
VDWIWVMGYSSAWREGIIAEGVSLSNLAIPTMNEEFTALIDCDLSCRDDGIGLGSMNGTEVGVSRPFDTPTSLGGNNMLIL